MFLFFIAFPKAHRCSSADSYDGAEAPSRAAASGTNGELVEVEPGGWAMFILGIYHPNH